MTDLNSNETSWASVLFSWQVALASHETAPDEAQEVDCQFSFLRLAAASDHHVLDGEPWHDDTGQCRAVAIRRDDRLYLLLQADGFSALDRLMNRKLWLVSHDGSTRALCAFDGSGRAELVFRFSNPLAESLREFGLYASTQE